MIIRAIIEIIGTVLTLACLCYLTYRMVREYASHVNNIRNIDPHVLLIVGSIYVKAFLYINDSDRKCKLLIVNGSDHRFKTWCIMFLNPETEFMEYSIDLPCIDIDPRSAIELDLSENYSIISQFLNKKCIVQLDLLDTTIYEHIFLTINVRVRG